MYSVRICGQSPPGPPTVSTEAINQPAGQFKRLFKADIFTHTPQMSKTSFILSTLSTKTEEDKKKKVVKKVQLRSIGLSKAFLLFFNEHPFYR